MTLLSKIVRTALSGRVKAIDEFKERPFDVQDKQLKKLLTHFAHCSYVAVDENMGYEKFATAVPVVTYEELSPFVDRIREGETCVLWDESVKWFAKSSGTTQDKSKFLPVTHSSLNNCHFRGMRDVLALAMESYPDLNIFGGRTLTLGGSHTLDKLSKGGSRAGDLSAILIENTPTAASIVRSPSKETALISDFNKKVETICRECATQDIRAFAGVPSWNLVLLRSLLEYTGKSDVCQMWPNVELFMHGGVNFAPYRDVFRQLFPSDKMKYIESYNASEGFFAIQDDKTSEDMLLMLDYEVFYEFMPMDSFGDTSSCVTLEGVKKGINYAMIITTSGGMWRYMIGDTVMFTSMNPYKIKITGRTKQFINAFGEELIVNNSDSAVVEASKVTGAQVSEYTVAPIFMDGKNKGGHEWIIEFEKEPDSFDTFCSVLDRTLRELNSDYDAKRTNNFTLMPPKITVATKGSFYKWMESRGKIGGQNKIPRLSNNREYIDSLINYIK